jgi:ribonuclease BN (tRNA processing enzyme)
VTRAARVTPIRAYPRGVAARVRRATDVFFPARLAQPFELNFVELEPRTPRTVGPAQITAVEVEHHSGAASLGLRVRYGDRTFAYSGDTQWTDALEVIARDSDLFVCECYTLQRPKRFHLDYRDLARHGERLGSGRIVLTHMGQDVLAAVRELDFPALADGQVLDQ